MGKPRKLTHQQVNDIRKEYALANRYLEKYKEHSVPAIAEKYNVSRVTVQSIVSYRSYTDIEETWYEDWDI